MPATPPATLTRLDITLQATQPVAWPHFAGSTLRGAFGRALRAAACTTGQPQCHGCALRAHCAYGTIFDPAPPAQPLHPSFQDGLPRYLVQPPPLGACQLSPGQTQTFGLLLLPGTQTHHSLVQHILRATIEKHLFQPGLFKLSHTQTHHITPATATATAPAPAHPASQKTTNPQGQITLRWHTPLRLQQQGKPLFKPQQLDATTLVRALQRRHLQWQQLTQNPDTTTATADQTQAAAQCSLDTRNLHWHDIQRHSTTQNQKLPLGGLMGSAHLRGPVPALQQLQTLLQLGEHIHIGKETIMGLGRYQLSAIEPG
jgi:hypothetical protein